MKVMITLALPTDSVTYLACGSHVSRNADVDRKPALVGRSPRCTHVGVVTSFQVEHSGETALRRFVY